VSVKKQRATMEKNMQLAAGTDKAFLEGKAGPTDLHEELHGK
jgi:hypothetical protein